MRPVVAGDKFSMRGTAEVMTDHGWIMLKDLQPHHRVATLLQKQYLAYTRVTITSYDYEGEMYSLKTNRLNMYVTKNHKLFVSLARRTNRKKTGPIDPSREHVKFLDYGLIRTNSVFGKYARFKTNAVNSMPPKNTHLNYQSLIGLNYWECSS